MKLKRIFLISGRYLLENPYRELKLKRLFEKKGIDVIFGLPSRKINAFGYTDNVKNDQIFNTGEAVWLDSKRDYLKYLLRSDAVLFGSWKSYLPLTEMAQAMGKPVVNFNTTSGLDHWPHGANYVCVKGPFSRRQMLYLQDKLSQKGSVREDHVVITGSIIHEGYQSDGGASPDCLSREAFYEYYHLDPKRPTVIFFPKGIRTFERKISVWFPRWSDQQRAAYNRWFLDKYAQICNAVLETGCNLIIKMHPTAYAAYMTHTHQEYEYWQKFPWANVLAPEHTYACYEYAACGIGINTHSALDLAYFSKPFIYVDSDQIEPPPAITFHINHLCALPPGPSSHWESSPLESVNPWFPSWLGYFCRASELSDLISDTGALKISSDHRSQFIEEFWYKADGKSSERIAEAVVQYVDSLMERPKIRPSVFLRKLLVRY